MINYTIIGNQIKKRLLYSERLAVLRRSRAPHYFVKTSQETTMLFIRTQDAASLTALLCSVIVSAGHSSAFTTPQLSSASPIIQIPRNIAPSRSTSSLLSKWDNLVDEDDDDGDGDGGLDFGEELPGPRDMRYIEFNIGRQHRNFVDIRTAGGPEMTLDVYSRKPGDDVFWFTGKVARVSDVAPEQAVARQWSLIETHAARLRPIELYPSRGKLELWTAPGDSELDVAYNRPTVQFVQMKRPEEGVEGLDAIKPGFVGFQGEIYEGGEEGFRTWRNDDGTPAKPEIIDTPEKGEKRAPTDAEMEDIQELLKGKDLNELFDN